MQPLRSQGFRLGSPAPTSAPAGKTWLQDFFTACNGSCTVDFVAIRTSLRGPFLFVPNLIMIRLVWRKCYRVYRLCQRLS